MPNKKVTPKTTAARVRKHRARIAAEKRQKDIEAARKLAREPFWRNPTQYPGKRVRKTTHVNLDPEGLRVCGYCSHGINPFKKLGTIWCCASCRQMAYAARKAQEKANA
jgi:hypothetical protein